MHASETIFRTPDYPCPHEWDDETEGDLGALRTRPVMTLRTV